MCLLLAGCGAEEGGILVEISSAVTPLHRLSVTIVGRTETLVTDHAIQAASGALTLPGRGTNT